MAEWKCVEFPDNKKIVALAFSRPGAMLGGSEVMWARGKERIITLIMKHDAIFHNFGTEKTPNTLDMPIHKHSINKSFLGPFPIGSSTPGEEEGYRFLIDKSKEAFVGWLEALVEMKAMTEEEKKLAVEVFEKAEKKEVMEDTPALRATRYSSTPAAEGNGRI